MRISGGEARGIPLVVPKGDLVRPATDGMRQAVFSSIASRVPGAVFWDLFAGSGAYGLEALSRGAAGGVWVEKNEKAAACVRKNIEAVCKCLKRDTREGLQVREGDALTWRGGGEALPGLVFIDPPYPIIEEVGPRLLAQLSELLAPVDDPVVVFEMPGEMSILGAGWREVKRLGKGVRQPSVVFYKK
jgi:16S rRNA (guanine966-N2)-methyltransferase